MDVPNPLRLLFRPQHHLECLNSSGLSWLTAALSGTFPYPQNLLFIGHEDLLAQLATTLHTGQPTALSQPQAISGLGGIGKTQLALEYAYRRRQEYQAVLWALADTREALTSSYLAIATLLNLPEKDEPERPCGCRRQELAAHSYRLAAHPG